MVPLGEMMQDPPREMKSVSLGEDGVPLVLCEVEGLEWAGGAGRAISWSSSVLTTVEERRGGFFDEG